MFDFEDVLDDVVDEIKDTIDVKEIKRTLDKACKMYYNTSETLMSDTEFDELKAKYEDLTGFEYSTETAPSKGKRMVEVSHSYKNLVGTLLKAQTLDDVESWLDTINYSGNNLLVRFSYKYDGNSISIEFKNGKVDKALTRGKAGKGADMTDLFQHITANSPIDMGVRYEAMLTYDDFEKVSALKGKEYSNPRSLVAGILGDLDAINYSKYITLVPLSCIVKDKPLKKNLEPVFLQKMLGKTNIPFVYKNVKGNKQEILDHLQKFYTDTIKKRNDLNYMIDGIVIEILNSDLVQELGYVGSSPKFAIALKFPYMSDSTVIEDIEFDISPNGTGRITPIAVYKPVYFNGAEQRRTSLANYKRYKELYPIGIGTKILVQYRNDVLSYVNKLDVPENEEIEHYPFITKCPVCEGEVQPNEAETYAFCTNPVCPSKTVGRVNNYVNRVNMKGIELKTLEVLFTNDILHGITDLYKISLNQLRNLEGFGEVSAKKFLTIINENSPMDAQVIAGMGIDGVGERTATTVLKHFTFDDLINPSLIHSDRFKEEILNLPGFSTIMTDKLVQGLQEHNQTLKELDKLTTIERLTRKVPSKELRFVATGDTEYFEDRPALKRFLEKYGHKLTGSVSGKTDYLITNDPHSGTVKNRQAQERNIPIINDLEARDIVLELDKNASIEIDE